MSIDTIDQHFINTQMTPHQHLGRDLTNFYMTLGVNQCTLVGRHLTACQLSVDRDNDRVMPECQERID